MKILFYMKETNDNMCYKNELNQEFEKYCIPVINDIILQYYYPIEISMIDFNPKYIIKTQLIVNTETKISFMYNCPKRGKIPLVLTLPQSQHRNIQYNNKLD